MSISGSAAANGPLLLRTLHGMLSKQYNAAPGRMIADTAPLPDMIPPANGLAPANPSIAAQLAPESAGLPNPSNATGSVQNSGGALQAATEQTGMPKQPPAATTLPEPITWMALTAAAEAEAAAVAANAVAKAQASAAPPVVPALPAPIEVDPNHSLPAPIPIDPNHVPPATVPDLQNGGWVVPVERSISKVRPSEYDELIYTTAMQHKVDPALVKAVIHAESNFRPTVKSSAGAQGLMQLMPGTAASLGVTNSNDPVQNVDGGTRLLRKLLDRYDQNVSLALAAYNAGPGAVAQYGGIPPYPETQRYVPRVLSLYKTYVEA